MAAKVEGSPMRKGTWTAEEDMILVEYVRCHGEGNWNAVQRDSGLRRCGKSCRLRWANHLRPNLKKGSFSPEEERLIVELHARLGNKWARMASMIPGRTDNEIKNYWNTRMKKQRRQHLPLYTYQHTSLSAPATPTTTTAAPIPYQYQPYNPPPLPSPIGFKRFRGCSHDSLLPPLSAAVPPPPTFQIPSPSLPIDSSPSQFPHYLLPKAPQMLPLDFPPMEFDFDSELQNSRKRSRSDMNISIFDDQDTDGLLEDLLAESCHGENLIGRQFHEIPSGDVGFWDNSHPMAVGTSLENLNVDENEMGSTDGGDLSRLLDFVPPPSMEWSGDTWKGQCSSEEQVNYSVRTGGGSWDNLPEFC